MAHFIRVLKARHIRNKWILLQEEKRIGLHGGDSKKEAEHKRKKPNFFGRCFLKLKDPSSIQHFTAKSFLGFTGGVLLTYLFFFFFYFCINISLRSTVYICSITGIFLCLGLAFSSKIRCYVLLLLPVFFSKQGRQALLAYALFLAFTGPAKNTMHNMGILSDSMSCGQEIVKRTLKQIYEMVKAPFKSVKETLERMTKALQEVIDTVQSFVNKIKRIILAVLNVIKKGASWLGSIINFCNKKVGTPFQRCMKTFDDAITDCKAKLGVMDFLCHVVHVVKGLCYTVKWLDFICMFTEFVSDYVVAAVRKKFSHSFEFETTASNSTKHIAKTILQKIRVKIEKLQQFFSFLGFVFGFVFLLIFFKVYYYKYKYLSSDRFDNIYLSKYIMELDLKRAELDKETVLPLELREKKKYAKPTSLRLLKSEKSRMTDSMFLLSLASFKVFSFVFCDYSLFWVLLTIYEAGHDAFQEEEKSEVALHIEGQGVIANFYRNLGKTFEVPQNSYKDSSPLQCLPDPIRPDTGRYMQIGFLVGLCWLFTVTEAYGLRLRHVVMSYYYPDRARERAVWLYNHILQSRASFLRFARRELRRKFKDGQKIEKVTFKQWLFATFPLLEAIFGKNKETSCLLCGAPEKKNFPLKRCKTPDCIGKYCMDCFASLNNTCTICKNPLDYGDVSDVSEEIDSSDEDYFNYKAEDDMQTFIDASEDKFMTFKDLEYRDRFRDVESNKMVDFAKTSDLYSKEEVVKAKLKELLQNRIKKLKEEKYKLYRPQDIAYQRLKSKLKSLIAKKKNPENFSRKGIRKLKTPSKSDLEEKNFHKSEKSKVGLKKSKVFFNITNENYSQKYKKLKEELKGKIAAMKEKRLRTDMSKEKLIDEQKEEIPVFYSFIENEKDFDASAFQSPNDLVITEVTTTFDDLFDMSEPTANYIL